MKIRLGFVTNSSSSSFTCVALYSEELYDFIQKLIAEKKYCEQPTRFFSLGPEYELHREWAWEELKFDRQLNKVQITEEHGGTDKESVYKNIKYYFEGLSPEEDRTLKELIFDVYKNNEYQTQKYKDYTDGYTGFDFRTKLTKADREDSSRKEVIQRLLNEIEKMAVDPETTDLSMKTIAMHYYQINGYGIFDPDSDRYNNIDKSFLDKVRLKWVDNDATDEYKKELLDEEKKRRWSAYLRELYEEALYDVGAIPLNNISTRSDFAVVVDSIDGVIDKYLIKNYCIEHFKDNRYSIGFGSVDEKDLAMIKELCYIQYLKNQVSEIKEINNKRDEGASPIAVIWESQLHDYLVKNSSLGDVAPKPVIGPNGTVRLKVPHKHRKTINDVLKEMILRWPSRVINPKTKTYVKLVESIEMCNKDIGYASADDFFDAYGFSIKQEAARKSDDIYGDFEYEKTKLPKEITITKYNGKETRVIIPELIDGIPVKKIGVEAFCRNKYVEEVIIPDSVVTVRGKAFSLCDNLKKIHMSNNISKIVAGTFDGCKKLSEINIPDKVEKLPSHLFRDCPLKSIHIGKSLAAISKTDFYAGELDEYYYHYEKTSAIESITIDSDNKHFTNVDSMILSYDGKVLFAMLGNDDFCAIPEGVEIIADKAFYCMGQLKEVVFPDSLCIIGNNAFEYAGVETVSFPGSVKIIGARAFQHCNSLESVVFSEGLEEIYNKAFTITKIQEVVFPQSLKKLGKHSFDRWGLMSIKPVEWRREIQKWDMDFEDNDVDTDRFIQKVTNESIKKAVEAQLDNKTGLGIMTLMMLYMRSDAATSFNTADRLQLEQKIISKKMEAILGTDLKLFLSFYKQNATDQLKNCLRWILSEENKSIMDDCFARIEEAFSDDKVMNLFLEGIRNRIMSEVY